MLTPFLIFQRPWRCMVSVIFFLSLVIDVLDTELPLFDVCLLDVYKFC